MAPQKPESPFQLSLTDRLQNVIKLTSALTDSSRKIIPKDAMSEARNIETQLFNESTSTAGYFDRIEEFLDNLSNEDVVNNEVAKKSGGEDDPDTIASNILEASRSQHSIGLYENCTWWRDGYSSAIYISRAPLKGSIDFIGRPGAAVALKAVTTSLIQAPHDAQREIRIMKSAKSPNILELWEHFTDRQGQLVLVFPFMPLTLADLIASDKKVNDQAAKISLRDMFRGLAYLHRMGIIHRDIKPSNIVLASSHGPGYITDFGIAWDPNDCVEEPDKKITDVGTTSYRAPELLFGYTAYGTELDMYAAGVTTAEVMCQLKDHLFEGGGRGTDLALLNSILFALGTPTEETWPEINQMPDWGKLAFKDYQPKPWKDLIPNADEKTINLIKKLVCYSARQRLTAEEVLKNPFFEDVD